MSDNHAAAIREIVRISKISGNQVVRKLVRMIQDIGDHADALAAELAEAEARAERLRKALQQADSRVIQYAAEGFTHRTGALPPYDWFHQAMDAQESNHYVVDGLQPGDLDARDG